MGQFIVQVEGEIGSPAPERQDQGDELQNDEDAVNAKSAQKLEGHSDLDTADQPAPVTEPRKPNLKTPLSAPADLTIPDRAGRTDGTSMKPRRAPAAETTEEDWNRIDVEFVRSGQPRSRAEMIRLLNAE